MRMRTLANDRRLAQKFETDECDGSWSLDQELYFQFTHTATAAVAAAVTAAVAATIPSNTIKYERHAQSFTCNTLYHSTSC